MASLNKVQLIGFVGADPEIKEFADKNIIVRFNLATSESFIDKSGKKTEITEWHKCSITGSLAKYVKDTVKKGFQIYIEGKMKTRSFEDKETKKKVYITEVIAGFGGTEVKVLGRKDIDTPDE